MDFHHIFLWPQKKEELNSYGVEIKDLTMVIDSFRS